MKKFPVLLIGIVLILQGPSPAGNPKAQGSRSPSPESSKITPQLQVMLSSFQGESHTLNIWVYFKDKGITSQELLRKNYADFRSSLNNRCLWRRRKVLPEENLVDFADLPVHLSYMDRLASMVIRLRTASRWLNAVSVEATSQQIFAIEKLAFVQKISPVLSFMRDDPFPSQTALKTKETEVPFSPEYGPSFTQLDQIHVLPLHSLGYTGKGVLVCLLDSGFRKTHEIFRSAKLVAEWDFVNSDNDVQQNLTDPNDYSDSHGTATWSLLGGYKPGELIGPAYGADFLLAKTESDRFELPIEEDFWVAGIEWAESLGAEVVSSSLGYTDWYTFEDMDGKTAATTLAADRAWKLGVVVVNAAGNERGNLWGHIIAPADGFKVIAAGAVDIRGTISSFSSPGPTFDGRIKPEVCALGVDNWIAGNASDGSDIYRRGSGTSFATPLAAGAAALLLEVHRNWTPDQIRSALLRTSSQAQNPDNDYGWGIIHAFLAANVIMALPRLQYCSLDDDTMGESIGNGNGKVEAGETIELIPTLKNESGVPAVAVEGTLTSVHPAISVLRSKTTFPTLLPFMQQPSQYPFVIKIPPTFLGHHATFLLRIEGPNSLSVYETVRIDISR